MFEALLAAAGLTTGLALGFAIAWAKGAPTREELAAQKARAEEQDKAAQEKLALVAAARADLAAQFKALSAEALDSTTHTFLELATAKLEQHHQQAQHDLDQKQQAVDALVQPIKESLTSVATKIQDIERTHSKANATLNEQLRNLAETALPQITKATTSLANAMRQPTTRGRWGELQLKKVLELAGMLEHCDFVEQPTASTSDDARQRPDAIVALPGGAQIIIDAKVPFTAYLDAHEEANDDLRAAHLKRHALLVRAHAAALGRKAYWDTFDPCPDFVIMFLPGEMLFTAALQQDPELIEAVTSEKVVLATPSSLIALLRMIALGWREQALAVNAQEVAQLGRQLYERVGSLAAHWSDVGNHLEKTIGAYNKSVGALESRVLVTARKFVDLKAATADDGELAPAQPVEVVPRPLLAPELTGREAAVAAARERAVRGELTSAA